MVEVIEEVVWIEVLVSRSEAHRTLMFEEESWFCNRELRGLSGRMGDRGAHIRRILPFVAGVDEVRACFRPWISVPEHHPSETRTIPTAFLTLHRCLFPSDSRASTQS